MNFFSGFGDDSVQIAIDSCDSTLSLLVYQEGSIEGVEQTMRLIYFGFLLIDRLFLPMLSTALPSNAIIQIAEGL